MMRRKTKYLNHLLLRKNVLLGACHVVEFVSVAHLDLLFFEEPRNNADRHAFSQWVHTIKDDYERRGLQVIFYYQSNNDFLFERDD